MEGTQEHIIYGEKILLRSITPEDTDMLVRWRNEEDVMRYFVHREPFTREGHETWLREKVQTGQVVQFILCEKEGARPVGSVYLRDIDHEKSTAEYGILIGEKDARGKGYASEAAHLALDYAFHTLHLKTVGLRVYFDNAPAIASYLHAGFRKVKDLPEVESTDGEKKDMIWMEAECGRPRM